MSTSISYDEGNVAGTLGDGTVAGNTAPITLTTSPQDLVIIKDTKWIKSSQLTIYFKILVSGFNSCKFGYYYSPNITAASPTWYQVPIKNASTGELATTPVLIDSGSYNDGTNYLVVDNVPLGSTTAFKVTGYTTASTATLNDLKVAIRDN